MKEEKLLAVAIVSLSSQLAMESHQALSADSSIEFLPLQSLLNFPLNGTLTHPYPKFPSIAQQWPR